MKYDHLFKELLCSGQSGALLSILLGQPVQQVQLHTSKKAARTRQRQPDFLFELLLENNENVLLHAEVQSSNDKRMPLRMKEYEAILHHQTGTAPLQLALYVGNEPLTMVDHVQSRLFIYRYLLVDIRTLPAELFLQLPDPHHRILAMLGSTDSMEDLVRMLARQMQQGKYASAELLQWFERLFILGSIRKFEEQTRQIVHQVMSVHIDIKETSIYKEGIEEGREEGREEGIEEGRNAIILKLLDKFDAEQVAEMVEVPVEDVRRLSDKKQP